MNRTVPALLAALAFLATGPGSADSAFAHGGQYRPPPEESPPFEVEPPPPPPPPKHPWEPAPTPDKPPPTTTPDLPDRPPTATPTPPDDVGPKPPDTGGGTPTPPGEMPKPPSGPRKPPTSQPTPDGTRRPGSGPGLDHWSAWWFHARDHLLDRPRHEVATGGTGIGVTAGDNSEAAAAARTDAWRARALDALRRALPDRNVEVFTGCAVALGKSGGAEDVGLLLAGLDARYRDVTVRESLVLGLGLLGRTDPRARARLEKILADAADAPRLRGFAAIGLGLSGDAAALPALLSAIDDRGARRDPAIGALVGLGLLGDSIAVPDLVDRLAARRTPDDRERRPFAAYALGRLGGEDAIAALLKATRDKDEQVRRAAALALGECASDDSLAVVAALSFLAREDRDRGVRSFALVALGRTGTPQAADILGRLYGAGDRGERTFAALGLGLAGRAMDADARDHIAARLRTDYANRNDADLRGALAIALGLLGDRKSVPMLRTVVADRGDPDVRSHAAVALGMIGDRAAADDIRSLLAVRGQPDVQREAALALGLLGDSGAVRELTALLDAGSTEHVRGAAAIALGRLGGLSAVDALTALLLDKDASGIARGQAAVALGLLLDPREHPAMASLTPGLNYMDSVPVLVEALSIP